MVSRSSATMYDCRMDKIEIIARLRAQQDALQKAGVEHLAIFGSRARGDNRPDSDLDVVLDLATNDKFSLLDLIGIEHVIADATGLNANALLRRSLDAQFTHTITNDLTQVF